MRNKNKRSALEKFFAEESIIEPPKPKGHHIHPETEKNIPSLPKEDKLFATKANQEEPKRSKWEYIILALAVTFAGGSGYWLQTGEPPVPQVEKPWKETQSIALEAIEAWERLALRAIEGYEAAVRRGEPHPGVCIHINGEKACKPGATEIPLHKN